MKAEVKKSWSTSPRLLCIQVNQVLHFLLKRAHIFPSLAFITDVPTEAFLVALDVPSRFHSTRALAFLT